MSTTDGEIPHRLAWVDCETTGLNAETNRIIDIAVVVTDPHLVVLDEFETKIKLTPADRAAFHPRAMEVNGYTDEEWSDAPPNSAEIWRRIDTMTRGLALYGQNVEFDAKFVSAEMRRYGVAPFWDRRRGDTALLSMRVYHVKQLANAKLETVYPALGGPALPPHRAKPDVLRAMWLYYTMLVTKDGLSPVDASASFAQLMARLAPTPEELAHATRPEE